MTEGTKNTLLGVTLAAILGGMGAEIGLTVEHGQHFVKIDNVLENQSVLLSDIKRSQDTVPAVVERSFGEIRSRLNMIEYRQAQQEGKVITK